MGAILTPVRPRLFLIDSYGFIFRAFHARARMAAPPMRTTTGIPTEAVLIFHNMLRKLAKTFEPQYMVAIFESLGNEPIAKRNTPNTKPTAPKHLPT